VPACSGALRGQEESRRQAVHGDWRHFRHGWEIRSRWHVDLAERRPMVAPPPQAGSRGTGGITTHDAAADVIQLINDAGNPIFEIRLWNRPVLLQQPLPPMHAKPDKCLIACGGNAGWRSFRFLPFRLHCRLFRRLHFLRTSPRTPSITLVRPACLACPSKDMVEQPADFCVQERRTGTDRPTDTARYHRRIPAVQSWPVSDLPHCSITTTRREKPHDADTVRRPEKPENVDSRTPSLPPGSTPKRSVPGLR